MRAPASGTATDRESTSRITRRVPTNQKCSASSRYIRSCSLARKLLDDPGIAAVEQLLHALLLGLGGFQLFVEHRVVAVARHLADHAERRGKVRWLQAA